MQLTRHQTAQGARWALDGRFLPPEVSLSALLELPKEALLDHLWGLALPEPAEGPFLPPVDPLHEVWAAGVTYLRSREAREAESATADVYERVYVAERPELFFKAVGWRVVGPEMPIRIRRDSFWNVPEPELTLVINSRLEIVGFCIGNDVSSRDIEGENPLYLPQAKIYSRSCAIGPAILIEDPAALGELPILMEIVRNGSQVFRGETQTSQMKRGFDELVTYLGRELDFPQGVFLMTGTGIVPPDDFTLEPGDVVRITIGPLTLANQVER